MISPTATFFFAPEDGRILGPRWSHPDGEPSSMWSMWSMWSMLSRIEPRRVRLHPGPEAAPQGAVHPRGRAEGRGGSDDAALATIVGGPARRRRGARGRGRETCVLDY